MTGITSPSRIVRDGYDRLDGVYRDWDAETRAGPRAGFPEEILRLLGSNDDVLGGAAMHFSSLPPDRTEQLLLDAGFAIRSAEVITESEPGHGPATFLRVIARSSDEDAGR